MLDLLFWTGIGALCAVVFSSFFEWTLHRYVMHRVFFGSDYAFKAHAVVHHQVFKADETYHLQNEKDKYTIPMRKSHGPILVGLCQIPFLIWALVMSRPGHWGVLIGSLVTCSAYFVAYEYMHWCMHLPKKRHVERSGIYFRLNGHHLLHHRYMHKNYNVVLPLADLLLGTLLLRSKISFAQATGPAVPNVQPKTRKGEQPELVEA